MKSRTAILCASFLIIGVAIALFQSDRALAHRRDRLNLLRQDALATEQQLATQRQTLATLSRDLSAAESQLTALPLYSSPDAGAASHPPEIAAWLANVRRLKKLFADHPEQRIPELRLLTDEDWLRVTHGVSLADDENIRRTLAAIRSAAVARFKVPLLQAFVAFGNAGNKVAPSNALVLAPFFTNPAHAEGLSRYEVVATNLPENLKGLGATSWSLLERNAIDEDFDTRQRFNPDGGGNTASGISAWNPDLMERTKRATSAFAAANPAVASPGINQLLPYFTPPLAPASAEKLLTAERIRQARR